MPRHDKSSPKTGLVQIKTAERQRQALELRKSGAGYTEIGAALKVSDTMARKYVNTALRRTIQEPADEVRLLELSRLDRILLAIWRAVTSGDLQAIDRALKVMKRRAELLGLDAPIRVNYHQMMVRAADDMGLSADERKEFFRDVTTYLQDALTDVEVAGD